MKDKFMYCVRALFNCQFACYHNQRKKVNLRPLLLKYGKGVFHCYL